MQNQKPREVAPIPGKPSAGSDEIDYTPKTATLGDWLKFIAIAVIIMALVVLSEFFWG